MRRFGIPFAAYAGVLLVEGGLFLAILEWGEDANSHYFVAIAVGNVPFGFIFRWKGLLPPVAWTAIVVAVLAPIEPTSDTPNLWQAGLLGAPFALAFIAVGATLRQMYENVREYQRDESARHRSP